MEPHPPAAEQRTAYHRVIVARSGLGAIIRAKSLHDGLDFCLAFWE
jgi:hypothetical protein